MAVERKRTQRKVKGYTLRRKGKVTMVGVTQKTRGSAPGGPSGCCPSCKQPRRP